MRSDKLYATVTLSGKELSKDSITSYGVAGDYILSPDDSGNLKISIATDHTTATTVRVYLNGSNYLGRKVISTSKAATYTVNVSELNMENGAINVLYIPAYRNDGTVRSITSVLIRVYDVNNPINKEAASTFGSADNVIVAKKGTVIKAPEIMTVHPGFKALGWTTGDSKVYAPGDDYTVSENEFLYVRWERTDMNSFMVLED